MTIIQKMLIVPLLSLVLYSSFTFYSYLQQQQSQKNIVVLRDAYVPLLNLTNENLHIFNAIKNIYKDAVTSEELAWLDNVEDMQSQLFLNLDKIAALHPHISSGEHQQVRQAVLDYQSKAEQLATKMIQNSQQLIGDDGLIERVEIQQSKVDESLESMHRRMQQYFQESIESTNQLMSRLQLLSSSFAIALMLFLLLATFAVSYSSYQRVAVVVKRMRDLALGSTDFSQRLNRDKKDELGYLIYWFNKLSDKLEQSYSELERVSITDKLTGLNNRNRTDQYFAQKLLQAEKSGAVFHVALLDIDHFKIINDTYGHQTGDRVLQKFAQILRDNAHEHDFIGRWGGEEFILILDASELTEAEKSVETLRLSIAETAFDNVGHITASFGLTGTNAGEQQNTIIKRADDALYQAKKHGRNKVICFG